MIKLYCDGIKFPTVTPMDKRLYLIALCIAVILNSHKAYSMRMEVKSDSTKNGKFRPLPILTYLPETSLAFGCLGVYLFKAGKDSTSRTSNIDFAAVYTLRHQVIIDPIFNVFTKREKYFIKGSILYAKFPEYFYGIGNETSRDLKEKISYDSFRLNAKVLRKVKKNLFVGLQYQYYNTFNVKFLPNSHFTDKSFYGKRGSVTSGIGPSMLYDSRNSILTPLRGTYLEVSNFFYEKFLGSHLSFMNFTVDVRKYYKITDKSIIAFQTIINLNYGHVPFKQLALMGGNNIMRGYYAGRYRDKQMVVFQAEYRSHLFWRIGYTLFAGVGYVSAHTVIEELDDTKLAGGVGLRYKLFKEENVNVRMDLGFGNKSTGLYITLSEAF